MHYGDGSASINLLYNAVLNCYSRFRKIDLKLIKKSSPCFKKYSTDPVTLSDI